MFPRLLLRLEGAALFFCALYFYHSAGSDWLLFIVLFLWPDIAMLGYLVNPKIGSSLYNLTHTEVIPVALTTCSFVVHRPAFLGIALIWLAHIGFDRALGYGLKYPTFFKDTHLQRL